MKRDPRSLSSGSVSMGADRHECSGVFPQSACIFVFGLLVTPALPVLYSPSSSVMLPRALSLFAFCRRNLGTTVKARTKKEGKKDHHTGLHGIRRMRGKKERQTHTEKVRVPSTQDFFVVLLSHLCWRHAVRRTNKQVLQSMLDSLFKLFPFFCN